MSKMSKMNRGDKEKKKKKKVQNMLVIAIGVWIAVLGWYGIINNQRERERESKEKMEKR